MANIKNLVSFISRWEGGYVNDPSDSGGPTNIGVTIATWQKVGYDKNDDGIINEADVMLITHEEMLEVVLRPHFWDKWMADHIKNQSIANILVDWLWHSGPRTIFIVQRILEVKQDGIVGPKTLNALNSHPDQQLLFDTIKTKRINDIHAICQRQPEKLKFINGWLNRIAALKYLPLIMILIIMMGATSCSTSGRNTTASITDTSNEMKAEQHVRNSLTNQEVASLMSDSITETTNISYWLPALEMPDFNTLAAKGFLHTQITRHRKVLSSAMSNQQESNTMEKNESSALASAFSEAEQRHAGVQVRKKLQLALLLITISGIWIYAYTWRKKQL